MKLGWTEWWLMNNPLRGLAQKYFEARHLKRMGGARSNAIALEIGCGSGGGIDILFDDFMVKQVHAFDVDPDMVQLAAARHRGEFQNTRLWVGNVRHLPVRDAMYDAVFDFGILHHVMDWKAAICEIHRVLKPGGRFYIEEIPRRFITHPLWRSVLDHPQDNRFDRRDLENVLAHTGFNIRRSRLFAGLFIWCVADKKQPAPA